MDEMRAAYGLLNLKQVDSAIAARKEVAKKYVEALKNVPGIKLFDYEIDQASTSLPFREGSGLGWSWNFAYFPILVTDEYTLPFRGEMERGQSPRDALYERMKAANVLGRRYFYPLITDFEPYKDYPSAAKENLPVARRIADQVICLPMHHQLSGEDIQRVIDCIIK